ncbi:hypothetical protein D3C71_873040 [compost metagenome]
MDFYKRAGVGRYSAEEQMMLDAIKGIIEQKQIPPERIPDCHSLDELIELKQFLETYEGEPEFSEEMEEQPNTETELTEEPEFVLEDEPTAEIEPDSDALAETFESNPDAFISNDYSPFADPIIERSYNQAGSGSTAPVNEEQDTLNLEETKGNPLGDLPPHTKRRTAEQTADTFLKAYAKIAPMPFKWWAKFPESKIEKMAFKGEIDLSIEVSDGVTFDDYMKQTNEQLDEIFAVDEETLSDIREPLIEVLMEQNMELTPAQRLMAAVFSHIMQMVSVAFKLSQQNNRILAYQKHLTFLSQGAKVA